MRIRPNRAVYPDQSPTPAAPAPRTRSWGWMLVIGAVIASAGWFGWDRWVRMSAYGIVVVDHVDVSSPIDGVIEAMHVAEQDDYRGGEPLYVVRDQQGRDELELLRLQLEVLQSKQSERALALSLQESDRMQQFADQKNWFRSLMEDARREGKLVDVQLVAAEALLPAAEIELDRLEKLRDNESSGAQELADARAEVARLKGQVSELLSARQAASGEVDVLSAAIATPLPEAQDLMQSLEPLFKETAVLRREMELLGDRLERQTIRVASAGRVSRIEHRPGEYVKAGDPILRIEQTGTLHVVAYFQQRFADDLSPGMAVRVISPYGPHVAGKVRTLKWPMTQLPPALANTEPDGATLLPVEIEIDPAAARDLIPGTVVRVKAG